MCVWTLVPTKLANYSYGRKALSPFKFASRRERLRKEVILIIFFFYLTIGSYNSVRSSRYEARRKFGEHERCVRVARGVAESNSSFLSALQTSQVNQYDGKFFFSRGICLLTSWAYTIGIWSTLAQLNLITHMYWLCYNVNFFSLWILLCCLPLPNLWIDILHRW